MPPPLPSPPWLAADVEDDGNNDCEEDDGRSGRAVDCAVTVLGSASSVDKDAVEDDSVVATEALEDVGGEGSEVGDTDVEDVDDATLEAL